MSTNLEFLREEYFSLLEQLQLSKQCSSHSSTEMIKKFAREEIDLIANDDHEDLLRREILEPDAKLKEAYSLDDEVKWVIAILKRIPFKGNSTMLKEYLSKKGSLPYFHITDRFISIVLEVIPFVGENREEGHMIMLSSKDLKNMETRRTELQGLLSRNITELNREIREMNSKLAEELT